ncbi:PAP2 domain protein [Talaromyces proteolyticus]|uniref:PAP2 domain protein n=1 Tax=Talaromyces proteolyticus TaxID=1131652 RepID=A0AAD4KQL2_9EURO|nr:PAP2 domain protein [Talaromyces proteolyticus]KAH8693249.1 PAP2 domain protein [Talaromyces proteolyticus]
MSSSALAQSQLRHAIVRISKLVVTSYILDWILMIAVAGIGGGFSSLTPSQRPFILTDPDISLPYVSKDTVSSAVLIIVGLVAPAVIIVLFSLLLVPSPRALKDAPYALIWRRKIWEWNAGWMGLALALAATFCATEGLKDVIGKPRPDLIGRCNPDLSNISRYAVGGLGRALPGAPTYVTLDICRNQDSNLRKDGFAAWPSGHSSFSFAGMLYLTLWLCAKFSVAFPYLGPLAFGAKAPAAQTAAVLPESSHDAISNAENSKSTLHDSADLSPPSSSTSLRGQGAAPPVYLQILCFFPICVAFYIACSRYHDHRHAGFDIISGAVLGIFFAYVGFHMYHLPIRRSDGWAWAARSRSHAFFRGFDYADLTITEGWAAESRVLSTTADNNEPRGEAQV